MLLGLTRGQIEELNTIICGTQTIEGAPGLLDEHLRSSIVPTSAAPTGSGTSPRPATSG